MENESFVRASEIQTILEESRWLNAGEMKGLIRELSTLTREQIVESLWLDAKAHKPEKSDKYLVKYRSESDENMFHYAEVYYSKKWDRWNFFDDLDPAVDGEEDYPVDYFMEVRI